MTYEQEKTSMQERLNKLYKMQERFEKDLTDNVHDKEFTDELLEGVFQEIEALQDNLVKLIRYNTVSSLSFI